MGFECVLQVLLNIWNDHMGASKVHGIPLPVGLAIWLSPLASWPVGEEMVNELNWKDLDLRNVFEGRNIYMLTLGDIQEDTIDEK